MNSAKPVPFTSFPNTIADEELRNAHATEIVCPYYYELSNYRMEYCMNPSQCDCWLTLQLEREKVEDDHNG